MQALWLPVLAATNKKSLELQGCKGHLTERTLSYEDISIAISDSFFA